MIALVEGAERQKTPNEIALNILLAGPHDHLPARGRDAPAVRDLLATPQQSIIVLVGAAGVPDPDHHRRAAVGDRHRRHGPARAAQRAGHERPGRRSRRRLLDAAARQDRHDHPRQPPGRRVPPGPRRHDERARRGRAALEPRRRDPRGPLDRGPRQGALRAARAGARRRRAGAVHRPDPHERRRPRRAARSARARPTRCGAGSRSRAAPSRPSSRRSSTRIAAQGGTPLVVAEAATGASRSGSA